MPHPLYSDAYEGLPTTAPIGCPHLIKLGPHLEDEALIKDLHIADGIATVLYHYNPDVLTKFLDKKTVEFEFYRKDMLKGDLCINRGRSTIMCHQWATNSQIKTRTMEMSFDVDVNELAGFWNPGHFYGGCVCWKTLVDSDALGPIEYFGAKLAQEIILSGAWKTGYGVEFTVEMKSASA